MPGNLWTFWEAGLPPTGAISHLQILRFSGSVIWRSQGQLSQTMQPFHSSWEQRWSQSWLARRLQNRSDDGCQMHPLWLAVKGYVWHEVPPKMLLVAHDDSCCRCCWLYSVMNRSVRNEIYLVLCVTQEFPESPRWFRVQLTQVVKSPSLWPELCSYETPSIWTSGPFFM